MDDPPSRRYEVTVIVARDDEHLLDPVAFAMAAGQAAAVRHASGVTTAHSAGQVSTVVTVQIPDRASAVATALAVVSDALGRPVVSPGR